MLGNFRQPTSKSAPLSPLVETKNRVTKRTRIGGRMTVGWAGALLMPVVERKRSTQ